MGKHVGAVGTGTIGPLGVGPVGLLGFGPDGPVGFLFDGLDLVIDENKIILRQFRAVYPNLLGVVQNNWKRNT